MQTTKQCSNCKEIKPLSYFYKDKRRPLCVRSRCKQCYNSIRYAYRKTEKGNIIWREARKRQQDNYKKNLTDGYIKSLLVDKILKVSDIPQELIVLKRNHIKLKEALHEKEQQ